MPTEAEIERAVAVTGHARLRDLVASDNPDDAQRGRYSWFVREVARTGAIPGSSPPTAAPPPPLVPLADSLRAIRIRDGCPHAGPAACGCSGSHRCARLGEDVTLAACLACPLASEPSRPA